MDDFIAGLIIVVALFTVYLIAMYAWSLSDSLRDRERELERCRRRYTELVNSVSGAAKTLALFNGRLEAIEETLRELREERCRVVEVVENSVDNEDSADNSVSERLAVALFDVFLAQCVISEEPETDDEAKRCGDHAAELVNNILNYAAELDYTDMIDNALEIALAMKRGESHE